MHKIGIVFTRLFQIISFYEKDTSGVLNVCKLQELKFRKVTEASYQPITKENEIRTCVKEVVMYNCLLTKTENQDSIKISNPLKTWPPYLD